jgi:hypothetical protein
VVPGGRNPGGTRNATVPLQPPQYCELVAVDDPEGEWGAALSATLGDGDRLIGWAVRPDDLDGVARRLGVEPTEGTTEFEDGTVSWWRMVGDPLSPLPFFVSSPVGPARTARHRVVYERAQHDRRAERFAWLEVGGDERELREWLGPNELPIRYVGGERGIRAAAIATGDGGIVLR